MKNLVSFPNQYAAVRLYYSTIGKSAGIVSIFLTSGFCAFMSWVILRNFMSWCLQILVRLSKYCVALVHVVGVWYHFDVW
ncbi:hypothetical protein EV426DRAFT_606438, partial [Tirmania nivea]